MSKYLFLVPVAIVLLGIASTIKGATTRDKKWFYLAVACAIMAILTAGIVPAVLNIK